MKKIAFFALVAGMAFATVSCNKSPKANLSSDVDSLSYAIGLANGSQITGYLAMQGIDTTYMADFVRGFKEGARAGGD